MTCKSCGVIYMKYYVILINRYYNDLKGVITLLNVKYISRVMVNAVCIIKLSFSFHLLNKKERAYLAWKEYFIGIDCIFEYH